MEIDGRLEAEGCDVDRKAVSDETGEMQIVEQETLSLRQPHTWHASSNPGAMSTVYDDVEWK